MEKPVINQRAEADFWGLESNMAAGALLRSWHPCRALSPKPTLNFHIKLTASRIKTNLTPYSDRCCFEGKCCSLRVPWDSVMKLREDRCAGVHLSAAAKRCGAPEPATDTQSGGWKGEVSCSNQWFLRAPVQASVLSQENPAWWALPVRRQQMAVLLSGCMWSVRAGGSCFNTVQLSLGVCVPTCMLPDIWVTVWN